jgi:hypothetical protein
LVSEGSLLLSGGSKSFSERSAVPVVLTVGRVLSLESTGRAVLIVSKGSAILGVSVRSFITVIASIGSVLWMVIAGSAGLTASRGSSLLVVGRLMALDFSAEAT